MSPEPVRPNAEKSSRPPGVIRRHTALALPHIRQRWAQITRAARQMVRTRRPELRPRLEMLKKFAGSLQSRQHPLRGAMRPAKKRPPAWQSMDMVLPNGSTLEEAQPDFLLGNLAGGMPGMGMPGGQGQVLPPFESSGSYGQRSPEPKLKATETAARRWKKPAPGSRLHSKVEEIHAGKPVEAAEKEPEASVPPQPQGPVLPAAPLAPKAPESSPARAKESPAGPAPAIEPLAVPRRPRSHIEELPAHSPGPDEEPPEEPGPDEDLGGPEPRRPSRPPPAPPAPRTPPETIQRQALPQTEPVPAQAHPKAPASHDLPRAPGIPEERRAQGAPEAESPGYVPEEKRLRSVPPQAQRPPASPAQLAPAAPAGTPAAAAAEEIRPSRPISGFKSALQKAQVSRRGAARLRSPLFLRQAPVHAQPPLMILRHRAAGPSGRIEEAGIIHGPARPEQAAAFSRTPRFLRGAHAPSPSSPARPSQAEFRRPGEARPEIKAGPATHLVRQPAEAAGELPEPASTPAAVPGEAAGISGQASETPLPSPELPVVKPAAARDLPQARPAALGAAHPSIAERILPLRQTVALRRPLAPVNAVRTDSGAALTAEAAPIHPAAARRQRAAPVQREALAQEEIAGGAPQPQGGVQPPYQATPRGAKASHSRSRKGRRPAGVERHPNRLQRAPAVPAPAGEENLIIPPHPAARHFVFQAPLVSQPGRMRILHQAGQRAARAGKRASRPVLGSAAPGEPGEASLASFNLTAGAAGPQVPFQAVAEGELAPAAPAQPSNRPELGLASLDMPPLRGRSQPEAGQPPEPGAGTAPGAVPFSAAPAGQPAGSGRSSGPAAAEMHPAAPAIDVIQRSPEPPLRAYIQREEAGPSVPAEETEQEPAPDPRELARLVYPIIKRMLAQEKERMRGYS